MAIRVIIFLTLNFAALGIGGLFTGKGVPSSWYASLNKAPWTPPGWVFGSAWTTIMICYAFFMAFAFIKTENTKLLLLLFGLQWALNVMWNPLFFHFHSITVALVVIGLLTILIGAFILLYWNDIRIKALLALPYFVWLCIATSLNLYIVIKN